MLWNMPCATLGRRCGSIAYLSSRYNLAAGYILTLQSYYYQQQHTVPQQLNIFNLFYNKLINLLEELLFN